MHVAVSEGNSYDDCNLGTGIQAFRKGESHACQCWLRAKDLVRPRRAARSSSVPRTDDAHEILREERSAEPIDRSHEYQDAFGNRCWRILSPAVNFSFRYDAEVIITGELDPGGTRGDADSSGGPAGTPLAWTLPSRYILSDVLGSTVWDLFGSTPPGWGRVQAICDWVHQHIQFRAASTTPATTSLDVYHQRYGFCRDFAHLGITMCRASIFPHATSSATFQTSALSRRMYPWTSIPGSRPI